MAGHSLALFQWVLGRTWSWLDVSKLATRLLENSCLQFDLRDLCLLIELVGSWTRSLLIDKLCLVFVVVLLDVVLLSLLTTELICRICIMTALFGQWFMTDP
jgi:hypothetical protein